MRFMNTIRQLTQTTRFLKGFAEKEVKLTCISVRARHSCTFSYANRWQSLVICSRSCAAQTVTKRNDLLTAIFSLISSPTLAQLIINGIIVMCFAKRKYRYAYLVSSADLWKCNLRLSGLRLNAPERLPRDSAKEEVSTSEISRVELMQTPRKLRKLRKWWRGEVI